MPSHSESCSPPFIVFADFKDPRLQLLGLRIAGISPRSISKAANGMQCHSTNASYLFQKDKFYDTSYDTNDNHIQYGRRAGVFKFSFMWKAKGAKGLEEHVNQFFKMSELLTAAIRSKPVSN
ncbi:hypothetical protein GQX74_001663 [Glossina fuscipes]|nr:hypothetical protein GQX74_001663 [Glossina fuscipes]